MNPLDYSTATWEALQTRLKGLRLEVLDAWKQHGPGTTREVSTRSGIDILTFRPRTTELLQLGLLALVEAPEDADKTEGHYRALTLNETFTRFEQLCAAARRNETQLELQPN